MSAEQGKEEGNEQGLWRDRLRVCECDGVLYQCHESRYRETVRKTGVPLGQYSRAVWAGSSDWASEEESYLEQGMNGNYQTSCP